MSVTAEKIAELKDTIATLEAFERGEDVQWLDRFGRVNVWEDDNNPVYSLALGKSIRIKPKPREWWVNLYSDGRWVWTADTKHGADDNATRDRIECIHVREVIEPC